MFLDKNDSCSYYTYPCQGLIIHFEDGSQMIHPTIKLNLLSVQDMNRIRMLEAYGTPSHAIHEEICRKCIIGILHFEDKKIDYNNSPAGLFKTIAEIIILKSKGIEADIEKVFQYYASKVTIFDQIKVIICKYTNISLLEVNKYPIDQLIREYAMIHKTFPTEVQELILEKEK